MFPLPFKNVETEFQVGLAPAPFVCRNLPAVPAGNVVQKDATRNDLGLQTMVNKIRTSGGSLQNVVCWVTYTLAAAIRDKINYTGSEAGFTAGQNGYLGKIAGVNTVEVPDLYLFGGVSALAADKRAIVNVTPKMDPAAGGMVLLTQVPSFSGVEIQLRDRSDTFVLNKKASSVASLETSASTTTTT